MVLKERLLTYSERYKLWFANNYETGMEYNEDIVPDFDDDYYKPTPTKLITITYKNEKTKIMNRIHVKFIKWLSNKFGYKIAMLKASNGTTTIEGDKELLRYVDISGYFFKKEPLKRTYPKVKEPKPIKPLTSEQLKELGLSINVDVSDCKNFKEASKVQDQIINGDVKINIIKK